MTNFRLNNSKLFHILIFSNKKISAAPSRIIIIEEAGIAGGAMAICALLICIVGIVIWMKGSSVSRKYEFEVESQIGHNHRETGLTKTSSTQKDEQPKISDRICIAITYQSGR